MSESALTAQCPYWREPISAGEVCACPGRKLERQVQDLRLRPGECDRCGTAITPVAICSECWNEKLEECSEVEGAAGLQERLANLETLTGYTDYTTHNPERPLSFEDYLQRQRDLADSASLR